ncbi:histone deacetylase 5-like isoform X1 [Helianthus annuus]|uniref:histone deacetylase 5-like isoform X1 n=1 Tax=Helianthus annuus TaxID=4232 RepID=UPI00165312AC|nr:histone deacetylase 5-like isoform X1 [Helianthus annuus]KAJ0541056.1 putative histone deacetylase [Helianthus annuus]KAJ0706142.1 putative histone deacetylase [Helianthus annuus]
MFRKDSRVLFFSFHSYLIFFLLVLIYVCKTHIFVMLVYNSLQTCRHEYGSFYPTGDDGSHIMIGEGAGAGYNINVPWENGQCEDADYITVWNHILIPVAREFNPEIIIIPTGFDAAIGDPLGGCRITPHGYSILLIGGGMVSTMVLRSPKMMGYDNNESGNEGNSRFSVRFEILTKSDNLELCN